MTPLHPRAALARQRRKAREERRMTRPAVDRLREYNDAMREAIGATEAMTAALRAALAVLPEEPPETEEEPAPCPAPEVGQKWESSTSGRFETIFVRGGVNVLLTPGGASTAVEDIGWAEWHADERLLSPEGEVLWTGPEWRGGES